MTFPAPSPIRRLPIGRMLFVASGLTAGGFIVSRLPRILANAGGLAERGLHGPDLALFAAQPTVIQAHILAALAAVLVGAGLMSVRKGRTLHRTGGWLWVALMATVAVSSLFITTLTPGRWSYIHLFSGWVALGLPFAVLAARRHDVKRHRWLMVRLFYATLLIAGAFTFIPGRLMWRLFVG